MDQYKISQNPGTSNQKAPKKKAVKAGPRSKAPKQRNTRSLSPQLVLGGIVVVMVLILAGIAWAHFFSKSGDSPTASKPTASVKKGGVSGSSGVVAGETYSGVTTAIDSKSFGALNRYYAKNVRVIIKRTGVDQNVSGSGVGSLINNLLNSAETPWDWHVSADQLAAWQQGPYGEYFTGDVIVGVSPDGTVVSIEVNPQGEITTIFIIPVADLTPPTTNPATGGGTGDTTTPTPTNPTPTPVTDGNNAD